MQHEDPNRPARHIIKFHFANGADLPSHPFDTHQEAQEEATRFIQKWNSKTKTVVRIDSYSIVPEHKWP